MRRVTVLAFAVSGVALSVASCGGAAPKPAPAVQPIATAPVATAPVAITPVAEPADAGPSAPIASPQRTPPKAIFLDPGGDPRLVFDRSAATATSTIRDVLRLYDDRAVCFHDERPKAAAGVRFAPGSSRIGSLDALFGPRSIQAAFRNGPVLHAFADPAETATEDEGRQLAEARGKAANQLLAKAGVPLVVPVVVHGWTARIDDDARARAYNRRLELAPLTAPPQGARMWSALPMSAPAIDAIAATVEARRATAVSTRGASVHGAKGTKTCVRARGAAELCFDPAKSGPELAAVDERLRTIVAADCGGDLDAP